MAGWTPLESSWHKFHRAGTHLKALDKELRRVMEQPQPLTIKSQIKDRLAIVRVATLPEFRQAGLLLGDTVTNYRAAADHLAWDLVKLGSQSRLTPQQARNVQFPMARSFVNFSGQRAQRMPGISDAQWDAVRLYQPYRSDMVGKGMRWLRDISDSDKHREVAPAVACATQFVGKVELSDCIAAGPPAFYSPRRRLYVGAKLMTLPVFPLNPQYNVNVESEITIQPSLGYGVSVMGAMAVVRATIAELLTRFEGLI